jgi:hypothetical protein
MLGYFEKYRRWIGGKWYKVIIFDTPFYYYTKTRPTNVNHWIVKKYKY